MDALSLSTESPICIGSEPLKALAEAKDGKLRVGAYAIRFSGPEENDLQGGYFTPATDFGAAQWRRRRDDVRPREAGGEVRRVRGGYSSGTIPRPAA